jgi:hypothetical protein
LVGAGAQLTLQGGAADAQERHPAVLAGMLTLDDASSHVPEPAAPLLLGSELAEMIIVLRSQRAPALRRRGRRT